MPTEINSPEELLRQAGGARWYVIPTLYVVGYIDKDGYDAGYVPAVFIDKKEAHKVAELIGNGVVRELTK